MKFEIGDRVRCINATFEHELEILTLKHGQEYVVQDIDYCRCGKVKLNVGAVAHDPNGYFICTTCGGGETKVGAVNEWFRASRFVKVKEKYKAVTIQVEKEEPILS